MMEYVLSSRKRRLFAAMIDGIVSSLVFFIFSITDTIFMKNSIFHNYTSMTINIFFTLLPIIVFDIIIPTYLWKGQTIGKKVLGIKVIKDSEEFVDVKTMTLRSILTLVGNLIGMLNFPSQLVMSVVSLVDSLLIFNDNKKTLHDIIAKTKVVYC
ncbi:hypothetical protein CN514_22750 [Bacillus sp. AFS001701]|uniref:RDD family protein n=1 Tax=Bacillus sp. AFS001701 TaxID=2033480 RepID=UPI000BF9944F|nr:RDD family protein [Bacillus sp. AFS001701]PET42343.1 hypothetical protein CN514_22750 [Bacillus sp. AFS001701]